MLGIKNWFNRFKSKDEESEPESKGSAIFYGFEKSQKCNYDIFRGYFDRIKSEDNYLWVSGWMVSLYGPYDSCVLYIDGKRRGRFERIKRPDVAKELCTIPNSIDCGFQFKVIIHEVELEKLLEISVKGVFGREEVAEMETGFIRDLYTCMPIPPANLINRVDELSSPEFYQLKGIQNFLEIRRLIEKHVNGIEIDKMLDWGCGSGRITGFFYFFSNIPLIYGCDIDKEAIVWAQKNFPKAQFSVNSPYPPTSYEAEQFEMVISFSVFTHLDRKNQMAWLKEMHRIMKPGGLFISTTHGMTAGRTILNLEQIQSLVKEGFFDYGEDQRLAGIAPENYYRAFFMTKEYVKKEWSPFFEIVEHKEHGASNYHDIVVLRKKTELATLPPLQEE